MNYLNYSNVGIDMNTKPKYRTVCNCDECFTTALNQLMFRENLKKGAYLCAICKKYLQKWEAEENGMMCLDCQNN